MEKAKGNIFVVSAPSGTGKTTLCRAVTKTFPSMKYTVSFTTRQRRKDEIDGIHYYFIDKKKFMGMVQQKEFVEWAEVYGNLYGTSKKEIIKLNDSGYDVIMDIDTNGAMQMKKIFKQAILIFILPPSLSILKKRLLDRKTESDESINKRLAKLKYEISYHKKFDYFIINDIFETALKELESIVISTKLKIENINLHWIDRFYTESK